MSKHTPGPWRYYYGENKRKSRSWVRVAAVDGVPERDGYIAELLPSDDDKLTYANAALLAAAPELLRLVRLMASLIEDWDASMDGDGQPLAKEARALLARLDK